MKGRKIKSRDYYIARFKDTHGDRYDYSKFNYVSCYEKVTIICRIHGEFKQRTSNHIQGKGCQKCAACFRYSTEEIKDCFKIVHGDKYNYSKVEYVNESTKVCIICPKHGEFLQTAWKHKDGGNCPECAALSRAVKRKIPHEKILKRFKAAHGDRYDYSKADFVNMADKVEVVCKKHGSFWQAPITHKKGVGCPNCADENKHGFTLTKYAKISEDKYKGIAYLYLIKCKNNDENFYKIGISVRGAKGRYNNKTTMPYDYEVLYDLPLSVKKAWKHEREICRLLKEWHYRPSIYFGGSVRECFSKVNQRVFEMLENAKTQLNGKAAY